MQAVFGGDVLWGNRACSAHRTVQSWILLWGRICCSRRKLMRHSLCHLRQPKLLSAAGSELREKLRRHLSSRLILSCRICEPLTLSCWAVLWVVRTG